MIGVLILFIIIGMFSGGDDNILKESEKNNLTTPSEQEIEIHDYYFEVLFEETEKLNSAEDAEKSYVYKRIVVTNSIQLEGVVKIIVAEKFEISEEELENIYLKVEADNNK